VVCGILSLPQSVMRRVNTSIRPIVRRASETTVYRWNAKFGGLTLSDAKRVRQLEAENSGLKRLLAEARLDDAALQGPARKKTGDPRGSAAARAGAAQAARRLSVGCSSSAISRRRSAIARGCPREARGEAILTGSRRFGLP
jgi:putative transposase